MQMVQKILLEHRLNLSDVEKLSDNGSTIAVSKHGQNSPWIRAVYGSIAKLNFCTYYFSSSQKGATYCFHNVIGEKHEVEVVHELAAYIIKSISKESRIGAKRNPKDKSYTRSFQNAAGFRIMKRVEEIITVSIEQEKSSTGTDLVVSEYDNAIQKSEEYLEKAGIELTVKTRTIRSKSLSGTDDGRRYANTLNIS